jgi:hypothetical protein
LNIIGLNGSPGKGRNTRTPAAEALKGDIFDKAARKNRREEVFPPDCTRAFETGDVLART